MTTSSVPTGTTSPSPTRIFETTPAAGDGISTVVLSVAISTSGASSAISSPSATSQRAISPSVSPSPRSGSLNSYGTTPQLTCAAAPPRSPPGRGAPGARPRRRATTTPPPRRPPARRRPHAARSRPAASAARSRSRSHSGRARCPVPARVRAARPDRTRHRQRHPAGTRLRRRRRRGRAGPPTPPPHRSPRHGGDSRRRAGRARARGEAARSLPGIVAQNGVDPDLTVHELRHAEVGRDACKRERFIAPEPVLTLHQREEPVDGDHGGGVERVAEAESEPRALDPCGRPLERQVVTKVDRHLRPARALDRGAADLAVALRRVPVAGRETRTVERDRQEEGRAGDELLAVDVAALPPRRCRRMHTVPDRSHAEDPEEGPQPHALPAGRDPDAVREPPLDPVTRLGDRLAPRSWDDLVDPHHKGRAFARTAHRDRP